VMKISFEYDGCLTLLEIEMLCREAINNGHKVFIVTKRSKNTRTGDVEQNIPLFYLAKRLEIPDSRIIFTRRELKVGFLIKRGIECHIDSCSVELFFIKKNKERRIKTFHVSDKKLREKFRKFINRE